MKLKLPWQATDLPKDVTVNPVQVYNEGRISEEMCYMFLTRKFIWGIHLVEAKCLEIKKHQAKYNESREREAEIELLLKKGEPVEQAELRLEYIRKAIKHHRAFAKSLTESMTRTRLIVATSYFRLCEMNNITGNTYCLDDVIKMWENGPLYADYIPDLLEAYNLESIGSDEFMEAEVKKYDALLPLYLNGERFYDKKTLELL